MRFATTFEICRDKVFACLYASRESAFTAPRDSFRFANIRRSLSVLIVLARTISLLIIEKESSRNKPERGFREKAVQLYRDSGRGIRGTAQGWENQVVEHHWI